ncbi:MAG TPA: cytochrome c peroxidase [Polyangia bacterium]|nr:cytochrome c peroxidase [Polyangia bacterium]
MSLISVSFGCATSPTPPPSDTYQVPQMVEEPMVPQDPNRVALGRLLFNDPRLSKNRDAACSTCHVLTNFGIDGRATSSGIEGVGGRRNTPSVLNAATHIAQDWDGRDITVEAQAVDALTDPVEMGMPDGQAVVEALARVPRYVEMFHQTFPADKTPISVQNVGDAIGAFERGLVTRSRWDKFMAGDRTALSPREKKGFSLFLQRGCIVCHAGPQVGGTSFQKVGVVFPWPDQQDWGRAEVTHLEPDRMVFKVPSLKNIVETAPYFHDGATPTIEKAIRMMALHQLGIEIVDDEVNAIADWMRSMTGQPDPVYIAAPALPAGG